MTPELTADSPGEASKQVPSTAGMTTKVVKGSMWTLAGQIAPLLVSLVTTPFVIRMLGAEGYGVFVLVGLLPIYLTFADVGMGIASTKFGSAAYAAGDAELEGRTVWTAVSIALIASVPLAVGVVVTAPWVIDLFKVPENLAVDAVLALRIAAGTFVLNLLNNIFNTPQLARLRMDLNTVVTSGFRIAGLIAIPFVIYLGGGIVGAVTVTLIAAMLTLAGHIFVSGRLQPALFEIAIDRTVVRPMLKFGKGLLIAGIASILLGNAEKLILTGIASVEALAYYSVAFTFAMTTTMFAQAMQQSLVPAFSQLLSPEKASELNRLFQRALRMNIFSMLPVLVVLAVFAKPFFTIWAGPEFGSRSTVPFYILLLGLFAHVLAYTPGGLLMASGRSDVFARIYWAETVPYLFLIAFFTSRYGIVGAALAWSIRATADAILFFLLCVKSTSVSFRIFREAKSFGIVAAILVALAPLLFLFDDGYESLFFLPTLFASLLVYSLIVISRILEPEERTWILDRLFFRLG